MELRIESLVHEHLHGDPAVGEDGSRHASRHGRRTHRLASLQEIEVHLAVPEQEEVVVARIAGVERGGGTVRRRSEEEGVAAVGAGTRRGHLDPQRAVTATKRMGRADG